MDALESSSEAIINLHIPDSVWRGARGARGARGGRGETAVVVTLIDGLLLKSRGADELSNIE